jgi:alanine-glyoxylate transaminase/serine-glyoxylate transaminase/serine-pyruvate transaminase
MQNYEAKKPSYFATPSPQLIHALNTALKQILARPLSERFQRHKEVSDKVKKAVADLGLKIVATKPEDQSSAMTAIYLPDGVQIANVLPKLAAKGVIFAGGLHKEIATKYIRFGHMGVSVVSDSRLVLLILKMLTIFPSQTDPARTDIDKALEALKTSLEECGYTAKA